MRNKLKKFTQFSHSLLPHEVSYLNTIQRFEDSERKSIFNVIQSIYADTETKEFDTEIDKRKYSNLKTWIIQKLDANDVDLFFEWLTEIEKKITLDTIGFEDEQKLLKLIRSYRHPVFYFVKFYELVRIYRQFLLIRLRYVDHQRCIDFLEKYQTAYAEAQDITEKLHNASKDIVKQYSENNTESIQWQNWLTEIFYNEQLDGNNRYKAYVLLSFISFNYQQYDLLLEKMDYLDGLFGKGHFYSKRILLNYYNSRLMLHSRFREYDKAIYFGKLSILRKTHDTILYVNNLCAVLLRQDLNEQALELMRGSLSDFKLTRNFHNKVGFVAFYVYALNSNGLYKNAVGYAESFLLAFEKEVLRFRWHLFFSAYLQAEFHRNQPHRIIRIIRKYKLLVRDERYQKRAYYLPNIKWYYEVARYQVGKIKGTELRQVFADYFNTYQITNEQLPSIRALMNSLNTQIPEILDDLVFEYRKFSKQVP